MPKPHTSASRTSPSQRRSLEVTQCPQNPRTIPYSFRIAIANISTTSRRSILLCRLLLRYNERSNVPLHPPPLERPLRTLLKSWPTPHHLHLHLHLFPSTSNLPRHSRRNRRHRIPSPLPRNNHKQRHHLPRHRLRHKPRHALRRQETKSRDAVGGKRPVKLGRS